MKIGYSSRWLFLADKEINIFEEIKWAHSIGFKIFGLNLDRKENRLISTSKLKKLRLLANKLKMQIVVRSPHHLNTSLDDKKIIEQIKKNITIAKTVGSDRLMIHAGHILPELELDYKKSKMYKGIKRTELNIPKKQVEKQFNQLILNLKQAVKIAKEENIKIALENNGEYYQFGSNLKEYLKILNQVNGLKASISTGHANISGNNVDKYISKCKNSIINLDLHDNSGKKDEHLPIGEGNINFKKIFSKLKSKRNMTALIDTYSNDLVEKAISNLKKITK
ncbi:MAG: sugar phosphate isomerase/epimerase [Candidatus Nanoarchaeia archaeon]|nr:sugar phosphate isomerase/epimerase [Candidatus Nanoarchaeia archaeon]